MFESAKTIQEELHEINCRLQLVEDYIRKQTMGDPLSLPTVSTLDTENVFYSTFCQQYPGYIPKLRQMIPGLTRGEERLCMMIKLNMTIREVARMLNIDVKSVHTSRARLKRKLLLTNEMTMDEWIRSI